MDSIFQKFWTYLRPHVVSLIVITSIVFAAYFFFKKNRTQFESERSSYADKIKTLNENHDEVIRKINAAIEEEKRQHEEDVKKWKNTLEEAQKKYDHDIEELNKKKNEQTKKLLQDFGDDPNGMAEQIRAVTGFRIVDPEKQK